MGYKNIPVFRAIATQTPSTLDGVLEVIPRAAVERLEPLERILVAAKLAGASDIQVADLAGMNIGDIGKCKLACDVAMGKLEQALQLTDFMRLRGITDFKLAGKIGELIDGDDKKVALGAVKLAAQVKGHLGDQDKTPPATEIHLHIMQAGGPTPLESEAKPVIDVSHLLDDSE